MPDRHLRDIDPPDPATPLLVPGWPLPSYRYVPGLHPHPFRHAGGHQFTGGGAPVEAPWDPGLPWQEDRRYLRGLDLLNHRYLWESHEALEALWHFAPRGSADRPLLQGLIQVGAGLLKQHMGEARASERLLSRAGERLAEAEALGGARVRGLALAPLREALARGSWPVLLPELDQGSPLASSSISVLSR